MCGLLLGKMRMNLLMRKKHLMSPYITYRDIDQDGKLGYYILQREFPHYIGIISEHSKESVVPSIQITNYYLWVIFNGTLRGNLIPGYKNIAEDIKFVVNDMAIWYYAMRIVPNEKKYKKFKYDSSPIK
jgi:hypothetical protein